MKKLYTLMAVVLLASMLMTACGTPATATEAPAPAATQAPAAATAAQAPLCIASRLARFSEQHCNKYREKLIRKD